MNPTHAGSRYLRFQGIDREGALMGDIHQAAYASYFDGPRRRFSMVAGTLNINSLYANRYFSIFTVPEFPCIELAHDIHEFTIFGSLGQWQRHKRVK